MSTGTVTSSPRGSKATFADATDCPAFMPPHPLDELARALLRGLQSTATYCADHTGATSESSGTSEQKRLGSHFWSLFLPPEYTVSAHSHSDARLFVSPPRAPPPRSCVGWREPRTETFRRSNCRETAAFRGAHAYIMIPSYVLQVANYERGTNPVAIYEYTKNPSRVSTLRT